MREFNLKAGNPLSLTLAADARLCTPNYVDDQIWELSLEGGEPPALALQTTYGLRARAMRLFPRFVEGLEAVTDPAKFASPPSVRHFYPNFLHVTFAPFEGIEVVVEYWTLESNAVAGRIWISNQDQRERLVRLEWVSTLSPEESGQGMAPIEMEFAPALGGASGNLVPVVFISGGATAVSSPFPALVLGLELAPGETRQFTWCAAGLSSVEASFDLARATVSRNWEAERSRIELLNAGQVEILTGDPEWDAAFALSHKVALGLFLGPTEALPHPSPVAARRPDDGYSIRGDGSDYDHLWNGQTALEAYFLAGQILPSCPELAKGLLENFLFTQSEDGEVDWRPGLGGQRGKQLATPLLASLAWRIHQASPDRPFLQRTFPHLLDFVQAWFRPARDRDGDGAPEWDHPLQAGFEDHPLFARWYPWAQGVDITTAESPSLCAFLYRECQSLIQIAQVLERNDLQEVLTALAEPLRKAVEAAWDEGAATYHYWDRDAHDSPHAEILGDRQGSGVIQIAQVFDQPVRLVVQVRSSSQTTRRSQAFIHGTSPSGLHRVERIPSDRFSWFPGLGSATSERTYTSVEYLEVQGMDEEDLISVTCAGLDCEDLTTLLPLWAGIPTAQRAGDLVTRTITASQRYWRPYGLPACPSSSCDPENEVCQGIHVPWCALIAEGLVAYGYRAEAAELIGRIMSAIIANLKREASFRRTYHAETGQGMGERDAISGLAPIATFLETLGVRLISPRRVALAGSNPFPWPVTVKYRGLTVLRQKDRTQVIFPDGQTASLEGPESRIVALE